MSWMRAINRGFSRAPYLRMFPIVAYLRRHACSPHIQIGSYTETAQGEISLRSMESREREVYMSVPSN